MRGRPVWLASLSRRSAFGRGRLATSLWTPRTMSDSIDLLRRVLGPAGDPEHERIFRMQITLCIHRALTAEEVERLPDYFHEAEPIDLAGGPVEVLWESEPGLPSTQPCHDPERIPIDPRNPLLWLPADCGRCEPCVARAEHDRRSGTQARTSSELGARSDEAGHRPLHLADGMGPP